MDFVPFTVPEKRFKIYENAPQVWGSKDTRLAFAEYIGSYPDFKSVKEGLEWIRTILDPYFTGKYGIVDAQKG